MSSCARMQPSEKRAHTCTYLHIFVCVDIQSHTCSEALVVLLLHDAYICWKTLINSLFFLSHNTFCVLHLHAFITHSCFCLHYLSLPSSCHPYRNSHTLSISIFLSVIPAHTYVFPLSLSSGLLLLLSFAHQSHLYSVSHNAFEAGLTSTFLDISSR